MLIIPKKKGCHVRITILLIALLPIPHFAFAECIPTSPRNPGPFSNARLIAQGDLFLKNSHPKLSIECYEEALENNPIPNVKADILLKIFSVLQSQRTKMIHENLTEESLKTDRFIRFQTNLLTTNTLVERMGELLKEESLNEASREDLERAIDIFINLFRKLTIIKNGTTCKLNRVSVYNKEKRLALASAKHLMKNAKTTVKVVVPVGKSHVETNRKGSFTISLKKLTDGNQKCGITQFGTRKVITQETANCILDLTRIDPLFLAPKIPLPESRFPWIEVGITAGGVTAIAIGIFVYKNAQDPIEQDRTFLHFE